MIELSHKQKTLRVIGEKEMVMRHIIDCDAQPFTPNNWSIHGEDQIASRVRGELEFNPSRVALHLEEAQKTGTIGGVDLKKALDGKSVLPANMLDYLLVNQSLIPEEWKQDEQGRPLYIFFWGTVYRDSDGNRCVRCLYLGDRWRWNAYYYFSDRGSTALLAS